MKPLSTGTFQIITIQLINERIKNVTPLKETASFFFFFLQSASTQLYLPSAVAQMCGVC